MIEIRLDGETWRGRCLKCRLTDSEQALAEAVTNAQAHVTSHHGMMIEHCALDTVQPASQPVRKLIEASQALRKALYMLYRPQVQADYADWKIELNKVINPWLDALAKAKKLMESGNGS